MIYLQVYASIRLTCSCIYSSLLLPGILKSCILTLFKSPGSRDLIHRIKPCILTTSFEPTTLLQTTVHVQTLQWEGLNPTVHVDADYVRRSVLAIENFARGAFVRIFQVNFNCSHGWPPHTSSTVKVQSTQEGNSLA